MFHGKGHVPVSCSWTWQSWRRSSGTKFFKMLLVKGRITKDLIAMLSNWRHSGSMSSAGGGYPPRMRPPWKTWPDILSGLPSPRNGCRISRNCQRLFTGRKTGPEKRSSMPSNGWPPVLPHPGQGGANGKRYYGYYSNVSRGKRKKTEDEGVPCILEADKNSKEYRKNWARLNPEDL